jgi:hypothetical protein
MDGQEPLCFKHLIVNLEAATLQVGGYPCFLRHDLCSGKHGWVNTCYVPSANRIAGYLCASVEYWHMANWFASGGDDIWVVREFIPVSPVVMTAFTTMPIGPERRYCVKDGEVIDHFPYWPINALWRPNPESWQMLEGEEDPGPQEPPEHLLRILGGISLETEPEIEELSAMACAVGAALGGEWSIDVMHTVRCWLLIDCAVLSESWIPSGEDREIWAQAREAS